MAHELGIAFLNAREAFENPMTAAAWWGALQGRYVAPVPGAPKPRFDAALLARLRDLRDAAAGAIDSNGLSAPDVALLSDALAAGTLQLRGSPPMVVPVASDPAGAVLLPLALACAALLSSDRRRLHRCAYEGCAGYFWDTTKNGSRRWCRLSCMERARRLQR